MDTNLIKVGPTEHVQTRRLSRILLLFSVVLLELALMGAFLFYTANASSRQGVTQSISLQPSAPEISLSKLTNGPGGTPQDGPFILMGNVVMWTYVFTNTGSTDLAAIGIVDDNGTPANATDDVSVCTLAGLVMGASSNCILTGTAIAGSYTNNATVTADAVGTPVTDNDASSYFGASPAISIKKLTNGVDADIVPGPTIIVGVTVNWTYVITNIGNTNLTQIVVTDDHSVTVTCTTSTLTAGEATTCSASAPAVAGQYANIGTVTAQPPVGPAVSATDLSHYFGQAPTNTATVPATPTVTGTPPTSTATGTITPNPLITLSVSPSQASVNQGLTFTIRVTNPGTAPAINATVSNNFPNYIDVLSVTINQGTATKTAHSISVALGNIMPGENISISVITKVNSSLTFSTTTSNIVTLTYNNSVTRNASVAYSVIASNVLPGTGELPLPDESRMLSARSNRWDQNSLWVAILAGSMVGAWGWVRRKSSVALISVTAIAVIITVVACSPGNQPQMTEEIVILASETPTPTLLPFMPAYRFSTPEVFPTLPDFPIPTPSTVITPGPNGDEADTSPVVRIVITDLDLDAVVRYVPFEGVTWTIEGLREEVAWLGNSSWPGLGSNTVLAGHVTVRGVGNGPFRYLEDLEIGAEVTLYTEKGVYSYSVRDQVTVEDTAMDVTAATINPQLTLITCTGWDSELELYRFRRVVYADLVGFRMTERQVGRP